MLFSGVLTVAWEINNTGNRQKKKKNLRRSHKVALVGGVNSAHMPLLIMIVSLFTSKPYLGNCVVII